MTRPYLFQTSLSVYLRSVLVLFFGFLCPPVFSQDARDEEIFGENSLESEGAPNPRNENDEALKDDRKSPKRFDILDTTSVGGRLEIETFSQWFEEEKPKDSHPDHRSTIDTYIDGRPHDDVRGFVRLRTLVPDPTLEKSKSKSSFKVNIDEAWIKTNLRKKYFVTYGRQHAKWGVGKFWNPSDFLTASILDPLATYDKRLGSDLLKIHMPREDDNSNFYAVAHLDDLGVLKVPGLALRAEFLVGQTEFSFSGYGRAHTPFKLASDVSSGIGPVDLYAELVYSTQNRIQFYKGEGDLATGLGFETHEKREQWIFQGVGGINYSLKYSEQDYFSIGAEYFYNGLGQEKEEYEFLSFLAGQARPLYLGRHYAGLLFSLPNPGSWNETSFYFNTLANLSDLTGIGRVSCRTYVQKYVLFDLWASANFGAEGEFRFRVPESFIVASSESGKTQTSYFPGSGTSRSLGMSVSLSF